VPDPLGGQRLALAKDAPSVFLLRLGGRTIEQTRGSPRL
jgi:hypothetical protein